MGNFIHNDGGRAAAGFKGKAGDCVTRAIAIASGLDYQYVYDQMAAGNEGQRAPKGRKRNSGRRTANHGIYTTRKWFKDWMVAHGFVWTPTMGIGTGCKVHVRPEDLPSGRLVLMLTKHAAAFMYGVLHDTYDCSREGTRCVYGYWRFEG